MVNAAGAAGITPNQQSQTVSNAQQLFNMISESTELLQDSLMDLSQEMKAPSTAKELGQSSTGSTVGNVQDPNQVASATFLPQEIPQDAPNEVAAAFSNAVQGQDEVEKKKKKKKFEEKLEMLAKLEGQFDLSQLNAEEQAIVEQFFKNLGTIRRFKKQLQLLEDQEIYYQGLLEKKKQTGG